MENISVNHSSISNLMESHMAEMMRADSHIQSNANVLAEQMSQQSMSNEGIYRERLERARSYSDREIYELREMMHRVMLDVVELKDMIREITKKQEENLRESL